jgi:hypothetical protein
LNFVLVAKCFIDILQDHLGYGSFPRSTVQKCVIGCFGISTFGMKMSMNT